MPSDPHVPPVVFLQPAPLVRVIVGQNDGHVDVADGEALVLTNRRGKVVVTLRSGKETHAVLEAEVTRSEWLLLQLAQVERGAELRIPGPGDEATVPAPPPPPPPAPAPPEKRRRPARTRTTR